MQRLFAILIATITIGITSVFAQTYQRTPSYGASGYGGPGTGGNAYGGGRSFTAPATPAITTTPSGNPTGSGTSDYQRIMNSVDSTTAPAFGPPQPDDVADQQNNASNIAQQAASPYTANPTLPAGSNANVLPSLGTLPNANGGAGYNQGLGATGAGGPLGSNGALTSPSGTTGLGQYNNSPYARGTATMPTTTTAAPGPATPTYTGQ